MGNCCHRSELVGQRLSIAVTRVEESLGARRTCLIARSKVWPAHFTCGAPAGGRGAKVVRHARHFASITVSDFTTGSTASERQTGHTSFEDMKAKYCRRWALTSIVGYRIRAYVRDERVRDQPYGRAYRTM